MSPLFFILISGVLGVAGQIMLKQALASGGPLALGPETIVPLLVQLATNPLVVLGLVVYVSGTFFWLIALSRVDLSYAYPFASLNYIFILVASWVLLGERPTPMRLVGVVAICIGVWTISRTRSTTAAPKSAPPVSSAQPVVGGTQS
jgi:multidrug transporter EmrE-like cation transporter